LRRWIQKANKNKLSGYPDWRLPAIEETLPFVGGKKGSTALISRRALTLKRHMFIPLSDASQGDIGLSISGRPKCSGLPAHMPAALAGCAEQNEALKH
jgi:hypothetical protein